VFRLASDAAKAIGQTAFQMCASRVRREGSPTWRGQTLVRCVHPHARPVRQVSTLITPAAQAARVATLDTMRSEEGWQFASSAATRELPFSSAL